MRDKEEILEELEREDETSELNTLADSYRHCKDQLLLEVLIDIRDQLEQLHLVVGTWGNIEVNRTR